jgi:hypothetical protein
MIDYGIIRVTLHPGLTFDQKSTIIKQSVENQLVTSDRSHYIAILNDCLEMSRVIDTYPFSIKWFISGKYQYVFESREVLLSV